MKVLFDDQIFSNQKFGGISRYFVELIKELKKSNHQTKLSLKFSNNEYIGEIQNTTRFKENKFSKKIISKIFHIAMFNFFFAILYIFIIKSRTFINIILRNID